MCWEPLLSSYLAWLLIISFYLYLIILQKNKVFTLMKPNCMFSVFIFNENRNHQGAPQKYQKNSETWRARMHPETLARNRMISVLPRFFRHVCLHGVYSRCLSLLDFTVHAHGPLKARCLSLMLYWLCMDPEDKMHSEGFWDGNHGMSRFREKKLFLYFCFKNI